MDYLPIKVSYTLKNFLKYMMNSFNLTFPMRFDISLRHNLKEFQKKMKYWFCVTAETGTRTEQNFLVMDFHI